MTRAEIIEELEAIAGLAMWFAKAEGKAEKKAHAKLSGASRRSRTSSKPRFNAGLSSLPPTDE